MNYILWLIKVFSRRQMSTCFAQAQAARDYALPTLRLRSESSSSSQIERITSSLRNVALVELTDKAPTNELLIAGNVIAMRETRSFLLDPRSDCGA